MATTAGEATHYLFCDESGSTGTNYLDLAQPFYVSAGWLMTPEVREASKGLYLREGVEFKASRALKSSPGQQRILDQLEGMLKAGATPHFVIVEKRIALAERAAATLIEPDWNPVAASVFPYAPGVWPRLVDDFYSLPESALSSFARVYHRPDREALRTALEVMAAEMVKIGRAEVARVIRSCVGLEETIIRRELSGVHVPRTAMRFTHGQVSSPNMPSFIHLLRVVDVVADSFEGPRIAVVHDETLHYEQANRAYQEILGRIPPSQVDMPVLGGSIRRAGLRHFLGFEPGRSAEIAQLQAADCLASTMVRLLQDAVAEKPWTLRLRQIAGRTLLRLMEQEPRGCGIQCHEAISERVRVQMQSLPR